jgi:hypothetical protein
MSTTKNVISLTLGIIGVVVGVLALLSGWIPYLGLATIPIAIIGFLLSGMGVGFACFKKFNSIELPILGCLICVGAILLPIFSSYLARAAEARQQAALAQEQKARAEIEAKAAAEARKNEIAGLESKIPSLQSALTNEEQAVQIVQTNFDSVQSAYNDFMATRPFLTNDIYIKIKKDLTFRTQIIPSQQQTIDSLKKNAEQSSHPATPIWIVSGVDSQGRTHGYWNSGDEAARIGLHNAYQIHLKSAQIDLANTYAQIKADKQALEKIEGDAGEFQVNKLHDAELLLNTAKSRLTQAQSRLDAAKLRLEILKKN